MKKKVLASNRLSFCLPLKGALERTGKSDPLPYYYHPLFSPLYKHRITQALCLLEPPYESILEVGYGSGILMPTLASISKKVSGVDINSDPEKVEAGLKKIGIKVSLDKADICNIDYPDESFDLVVAISVFEHISYPKELLSKLSRILRSGGHLLVGMPRVDKLMNMAFSFMGHNDIANHHKTDYKQFLKMSEEFFKLDKLKKMPSWLPESLGVYFNMLLSRR